MKVILGSSSPNRKELLDRMGIAYSIVEPTYEEHINPRASAAEQVQEFALGKADSVLKGMREQGNKEDVMILGFDSLIECEGKSIGKAKTKKQAFEDIQSFVGKPQQIMTGMAAVGFWKGKPFEKVIYESTTVQFRSDISNCQIRSYLEFGDWKGKCGSYSILGPGIFFLESIDGSFQNIVGIPVLKMGEVIQEITGKNAVSVFEPV